MSGLVFLQLTWKVILDVRVWLSNSKLPGINIWVMEQIFNSFSDKIRGWAMDSILYLRMSGVIAEMKSKVHLILN